MLNGDVIAKRPSVGRQHVQPAPLRRRPCVDRREDESAIAKRTCDLDRHAYHCASRSIDRQRAEAVYRASPPIAILVGAAILHLLLRAVSAVRLSRIAKNILNAEDIITHEHTLKQCR